MIKRLAILWVLVLVTAVPYAIYYLFFEAEREQYAGLIVFVLFWLFGYWPLVTPLTSAYKFYKLKQAFENIGSREELIEKIQNPDNEEAAIDFIARENGVPRFMAKWAYGHISEQFRRVTNKPAR